MAILNVTRLKTWLDATGLKQSNFALWQILHALIDISRETQQNVASVIAVPGGGTTNVVNNNNYLFGGLDGEDGIDGFGVPGANGSAGAAGAQGPAGIGIPGIDGQDGEDAVSIPGPPGNTGATGATGMQGIPGFAGIDGLDGEDGFPIPGANGAQGAQGLSGIPGPPGLDAEEPEYPYLIPGPTGPQGPAGGGGGGLTLTTVEVNLQSAPGAKTSGKFSIAGAGLTIGKAVLVQKAVGPYTGKGTREDEAEMDIIVATGIVTSAVNIDVYWTSGNEPIQGNVKFNYAVSA
jgi:hypothetical protein